MRQKGAAPLFRSPRPPRLLSSPFLVQNQNKTSKQQCTVTYLPTSLKSTSGQDVFNYRQEERRRRSFQDYTGQKITLEAVLNTTCKKCGCKGHFAKDCFMQPGGTKYSLIPEEEEEKEEETKSTFKVKRISLASSTCQLSNKTQVKS